MLEFLNGFMKKKLNPKHVSELEIQRWMNLN